MALRATPTIAICLTAGIAAGIALARPSDQPAPAAPVAAATPATGAPSTAGPATTAGDSDSPYLADGTTPASDQNVADQNEATLPSATPVAISIEGFDFSATGPVAAGSQITVTNLDGADHTLTARDQAFDTGTLEQNEVGLIAAPDAPGTYEFFCAIHPSMTGEFVVS